jgi:hypothetical protein
MDRPSPEAAPVVARAARMLATATSKYIHGSCVAGSRDRKRASRAVSVML